MVPRFGVSEETLLEGCYDVDQLESVDGGCADAGEERVAIIEGGGG